MSEIEENYYMLQKENNFLREENLKLKQKVMELIISPNYIDSKYIDSIHSDTVGEEEVYQDDVYRELAEGYKAWGITNLKLSNLDFADELH